MPEETRDNIRSGPNSSGNWARPDDNSNWRSREKKRLTRFDYFQIDYFFSNDLFFCLVGVVMKVMMKTNVLHPTIVLLVVIGNN